ncbi:hypothetical protein K0M31_010074 [Melipona bicolor]|uniref:Uncharacterized protein n=1 Tax=Melipona bicolor TaxID=60889 RepID=A0AA40FM87_9HYME|nr:hypothetical protein K0M31_010074 [Melipona bicolor]
MWARAAEGRFFGVPLRRWHSPPSSSSLPSVGALECSQPLASLYPRGYADPARPTLPNYHRPSAPASAGRLAHSRPTTTVPFAPPSEQASTSVRARCFFPLILHTRSRRRKYADEAQRG